MNNIVLRIKQKLRIIGEAEGWGAILHGDIARLVGDDPGARHRLDNLEQPRLRFLLRSCIAQWFHLLVGITLLRGDTVGCIGTGRELPIGHAQIRGAGGGTRPDEDTGKAEDNQSGDGSKNELEHTVYFAFLDFSLNKLRNCDRLITIG